MKHQGMDWDLLESLTFIVPDDGETLVELGPSNDSLKFEFKFITKGGDEPQLTFDILGEKDLRLNLSDWDSALGIGLANPIPVGTFSNRQLFLLFFVQQAGQTGRRRLMTITFYLGKEAVSG